MNRHQPTRLTPLPTPQLPQAQPDQWYRVATVAKLLEISRGTVYDLIAEGQLEAIELPWFQRDTVRVSASALRAFVERGRKTRATRLPSRQQQG